MKFLAFDIETSKITKEGSNLQDERPLGICCYALAEYMEKTGKVRTRAGHGRDGTGSPSPQMSKSECQELVMKIHDLTTRLGYTLLTHNGIGFDLDILAEESDLHPICVELARSSVDTMFHFLCLKGFPVGLDAAAKGLGLSGKTEGINGSQAPEFWSRGRYTEVLEYVQQDVVTTIEVAMKVEEIKGLFWVTKKGKTSFVKIDKWLTMEEAMKLPTPDTRWMTDPLTRRSLIKWMED